MENSKNLVRAFVVLASIFMASNAIAAQDSAPDHSVTECELLGGDKQTQPPGSTITTCCYETGCFICDQNEENCTFDPKYKSTDGGKPVHPAGGRLTKPVLKPGTMIMQPDTNTTVGTPAKPIVRKSIMQQLKRN